MHFLKSLPIDVFVLEVSEQSESIIKYTSLMHGFVNSFLGGGGGEERLAAPWLKAMIHESHEMFRERIQLNVSLGRL